MSVLASPLPEAWSVKLHWVFAAIFALRCLGDFRYVGLFRRVGGTDFATMDAKFFTPLCAFYAVAFVTLALTWRVRKRPQFGSGNMSGSGNLYGVFGESR